MTFSVYRLIDPESGEPRYVGFTGKAVSVRIAQHMTLAKKNDTPMRKWIHGLPDGFHVERAYTDNNERAAREYERAEILRLTAQGFALFNVQGFAEPRPGLGQFRLDERDEKRLAKYRETERRLRGVDMGRGKAIAALFRRGLDVVEEEARA